jgi:hypothetical protein
MPRVTQLLIKMENKPGTLAQICSELAKVAVNISAIMATTEGDVGQVRIVATPLPAARKVLDSLKLSYDEQDAVAIHVTDRPGALGRATRKLADAGINIHYVYGSIVKDATRALIVVGVSEPEKAAKLL